MKGTVTRQSPKHVAGTDTLQAVIFLKKHLPEGHPEEKKGY
jgi:hypothetical protein